jgi:A/G-specific adenine glycosylase
MKRFSCIFFSLTISLLSLHQKRDERFMKNDSMRLQEWFLREKRCLPWREDPTPYKVWISEVMLQQTRVSVVIEYFCRWIEKYPSIKDLSKATEESVMKMWEGLGYYNRARNLLKAAKHFIEHHEGQIPNDAKALSCAPGFGPYTVGAVLSFAFHEKAAAVDGNVARVMSRYLGLEESIDSVRVRKKIEKCTENFLPDENPHVVMEGLIELGAKVCSKVPQCLRCPLQGGCKAHLFGITDRIPIKKKKNATLHIEKDVVIIKNQEKFMICQKEEGSVLAGLYEFPSFERAHFEDVEVFIKKKYGIILQKVSDLPPQTHAYTHHDVELFPTIWETSCSRLIPGCQWRSLNEIEFLTCSAGHKRILNCLLKEFDL